MNKRLTISALFAGKDYCFEDYCRGIMSLELDRKQVDYVVVDNSNSETFGGKIDDFAKDAGFASYVRYIYEAPHFTIENTADYAKVSDHVHMAYMFLQKRLPDNEYTFNVEDDIEVTPNSISKLLDCFELNDRVGTTTGVSIARRLDDRVQGFPGAWHFKETRVFPFPDTCQEMTLECKPILEAPPFGIQIIGSAHMGCWLTKTRLIKEIGFDSFCGFNANDIAWGYKLNKAGYYMVIDWSVKVKHYHYNNGRKGYSQAGAWKYKDYKKIEGWFSDSDFNVLQSLKLPEQAEILELGTYKGRSTNALMELFPNAKITTVDPVYSPDLPVNKIRAKGYELDWKKPIDLLFIDDDHKYETVKKNIEKFKPFIKKGGYMVFHDYNHKEFSGIQKIVDELLETRKQGDMAVWKREAM